MVLLPSANFFQKSMSFYVFREPLYETREVYMDDLLVYGHNDDDFVANVRAIFQKCRDKAVTLSAKKLYLGFDTVPFVGHELDATGIKMSQKCIQSTIQFAKPTTLTELYISSKNIIPGLGQLFQGPNSTTFTLTS